MRLLVITGSFAVAYLGVELALRVHQWREFGVPILGVFPDYRVDPMPYSPFLAFGPRVNFVVGDKEYQELSRFDARGFRTDRPIGAKPSGELRVVTLGGSTTEDLWNASGRHWPWHLEQRLDSAGIGPVRVLNGGMSAYATPHTLIRLAFDLPDVQADIVLVMHNINDLTVAYYAIAEDTTVDGHYSVKYRQRRYTGIRGEDEVVRSRLVRLIASRLASENASSSIAHDSRRVAEGLAIFERNLRSIVAVARAHGITPVLMTMPFSREESHYRSMQAGNLRPGAVGVGPLPPLPEFLADLERYNAATRAVGAATGAAVLDVANAEWSAEHFVDSVHYSDTGSAYFAHVVSRLADSTFRDSRRRVGP